MATWGSSNN